MIVLSPLGTALMTPCQQPANPPIPPIPQLIQQVQARQKQLEKVRENYTYTALQTTQDVDSDGQVNKTESKEFQAFFVHGHQIQRLVKKDGKPLSAHDEEKESQRVQKMVAKAEQTPPDQPLDGQNVTVSRLLQIMEVQNPRLESFRGRPTIVFSFVGRKGAHTHGLAEDISKKLGGTIWIDRADLQVARLEVRFDDTFRFAGGLLASIQKGTTFSFDQAPVNGTLWLPTGAEGMLQGRVLLFKGIRQHIQERDSDYQVFHVEAVPVHTSAAGPVAKP